MALKGHGETERNHSNVSILCLPSNTFWCPYSTCVRRTQRSIEFHVFLPTACGVVALEENHLPSIFFYPITVGYTNTAFHSHDFDHLFANTFPSGPQHSTRS